MAGRSGIDTWFWERLEKITTLVVCHHGRICGAASIALGAVDMDSAPAGDRWLLWAHAREDADALRALLGALTGIGNSDRQLHAFAFASPLASGLEALPATRRSVTDAALRSLGLARRWQWTMMRTTTKTAAPTMAYLAKEGETEGSIHLQLDLGGRHVGEADVSMADSTTGVIWWLFIPDEQRGLGLGRELLRAARGVLENEGARQVVLFVDDDDPVGRDRRPAKVLYAAEGFNVVDRLASYSGRPRQRQGSSLRVSLHGAARRYASGCRCSLCTAAWRTYQRYQTECRVRSLELNPTVAAHGRPATYTNWGCRCPLCTAAHAQRIGRRRRLAKASQGGG